MALLWDASAALNIASGVLMAALGGGLLLANPRKDWNRVFGLFAVFWGVQIVSLNAHRVTDSEGFARFTAEMGLAFLIPLYFFLVTFAAIFPRPRGVFGKSPFAVALLMVPAGVTLAVLFAAPDRLLASLDVRDDGTFFLTWGDLNPYLITIPLYGAFFYAVHAMERRLPEAESAIERRQIAFVLAALVLFVAHYVVFLLFAFVPIALGMRDGLQFMMPEARVVSAFMLGGLALLGAVALRLRARARDASAADAREARAVLAVMGVAVASSLLVEALRRSVWPTLEVVGLLRSGSVALIVYAIVRYQLFDVDLRVKRFSATAAAFVAVVALASVAWMVLDRVDAPLGLGGTLAAVVGLVAFVPLLRVSFRLADRVAPAVTADGDHLYLRKLEVYRAAVEAAQRDGKDPRADDSSLAEVRGKLGLTERDHGVVVSLAVSRAEPARAAPDLRPGGVAFGKYVIDSVIAEGGFGRVFLARDRILGRTVVVKELLAKWRGNATVVKRFLQEARIAGQLHHPNIVGVFEVEQHGQDYYLVMEHVQGGSLAERLRPRERVPEEEAARVTLAVLAGLEAAHARGVVHRDVKPANVLIGARGEVKLTDFGIAQLTEEDPQRTISGLTTGGFTPGTLAYMSPEQARGRPLDHRSDVYAVGALLHRMLAGREHVNVEGLDELEARNLVAAAEPPPGIPSAPAALNAVVARALARDPEARFQSAREFAEALAAARKAVAAG